MHTYCNIFGDNLTNFREALGKTREELAAEIGVKPGRFAAWEEKRALPQSALWPAICRAIKFDQVIRLLTERIEITHIKTLSDGTH